ncbi:hypothetical protein ACIBSV_11310 [Embleya sp. NPDC050154]|uniref:hypothetical protein n=1 Tax=Embleya sp. NPDC050154 TaxID=3363988 RepID=UPI0037BC3EC8
MLKESFDCDGQPGSNVDSMNGQSTAQNTRECGADGDLPGFRNGADDTHGSDPVAPVA